MNEENIYSKLIYLVIDGEASDIERSTLFDELHNNPAMQNEFQIALKMNKAAETLPSMYDVPSALTNKLFDNAGLNYSGAAYIQAASADNLPLPLMINNPGIVSKIGAFTTNRIFIGIMGILAGSLIGFYSSGYWGDSENAKNLNKSETVISAGSINENIPDKINLLAGNQNKPLENNKISETVNEKFYKKDDLISLKPALQNEQLNLSENEDNFRNLKILSSEINNNFVRNNNIPINQNNTSSNILNTDNYNNYNYIESQDLGLEIEVRSSSSWNLPKETVYPSEISKLHNMSFALLYGISDEFMIGLEIRRETFYVKYFSINEFNEKYIYEQQPNLTNFELAARFYPLDAGFFNPVIQLNLGGGKFGFTARGSLGNEFRIHDNIAIIVIIDYSTLWFNHKETWNQSNKLGINYGINYKF